MVIGLAGSATEGADGFGPPLAETQGPLATDAVSDAPGESLRRVLMKEPVMGQILHTASDLQVRAFLEWAVSVN